MASRNPNFSDDRPGPHARNQDTTWQPHQQQNIAGSSTPQSDTASLRSVRKRASFFGRSNSDASSMRRAPAISHSTKASFSARVDDIASRPGTSASAESRRRKTEPLQSIRDSIFGGKKKAAAARERAESVTSRPSSRGAQVVLGATAPRPNQFRSEEDYYRHLRKQSISPPFNFQHVTHTERDQLTRLESVDERDLPGEFWSAAAHQKPRRRVHGIKTDNINRRMGGLDESPELSPTSSAPLSPVQTSLAIPGKGPNENLRLISPIPPVSPFTTQLPETVFDEKQETSFHPDEASRSLESSDARAIDYPKRFSSLNVLSQPVQRRPQPSQSEQTRSADLRGQESFYHSNSSSETDLRRTSPKKHTRNDTKASTDLNASMPPKLFQYTDVAVRSRQPLPSVPPQPAAIRSAPNLLEVSNSTPLQMLSPTLPPAKPLSPKSRRSSRTMRTLQKSPKASRSSIELRTSPAFSIPDATWEDDVDLAYEQEAESTCDFSWGGPSSGVQPDASKEETKRDSAATYHAHSPNESPCESVSDLRRNSSSDTINDQQTNGPHKRGTSVGHRGFLAARKNSSTSDLSTRSAKEPPAPLTISQQSSTHVSVLSSVFSIAATDDAPPKSHFTPADQYPHLGRVSNDYLSDPESCRNSNSSKHRKSSSYGSYGSYDSASTRPPPSNPNPNTTRWSIASSGSLPELMHSRPKSKSSLSRSVMSQPLETLPQSPPDSGTDAEFVPGSIVPRSSSQKEFIMRRPERSSDRMALEAAGRAVQRGRPASTARFSQHLEPPPKGGVRESWAAGPEWI